MTIRRAILAAGAFAAATTVAANVEAGWRRDRNSDIRDGYVVAESRFGNGTVSGPVRSARYGYEVRLPSGTWIACRTSCSETLRVQTVDFWERSGALAGAGAVQNECGIFGCLDLHWGY